MNNEANTTDSFDWIPFFEELADKLVAFRARQKELVQFLEKLRADGLTITPLEDKDESGRRFPLAEIDPFTYFEQELADASIREAIRRVRGYACDVSSPPPFQQRGSAHVGQSVTAYCRQPLTDIVVWANGDVTPCVGAQSFILGNIHTVPLEEIWYGSVAEAFRSRLLSGDTPHECSECICGGRWNGRVFEKEWHVSDL